MKIYKIICLVLLVFAGSVTAQNKDSYKIGIDDVLAINFWQETDLNSTVRVRDDGMITLPVIGDIKAAGLTTAELSKNIVSQIAYYNPGISQATVIVTEYNSKVVTITGAVTTPGELHFETIPNLLDVIRKAGGALPEADLSNVTIMRQTDGKANVINVNVLKYIKDGDLSSMPVLQANDLINVPQSPYGVTAGLIGGQTFRGKDIYFIYGAVGEPGAKPLTEDIELSDAIVAAGGVTAEADLKNVRVVMKDVRYSSVLKFNLKDYNDTGRPARYTLKPEDTIYIPYRRTDSFFSRLPDLLIPAVATTIVTTVIVNALNNNNSSGGN
jgi:polysaccharide export outer membrane protein